MSPTKFWCTLALLLGMTLALLSVAESSPMPSYNGYYSDVEEQPEEVLMDLIARYGQTIMRARDDLENSKRTVDFGLSRGYSGAQEAKHRMAMAVANFAGGPGRKRRSDVKTPETLN